jgi:TetR/AcrR family transcriptional regulator, ethionamide resistance regulator
MSRTARLAGDRRTPGRGDPQRARLIDAAVDLLGTTSIAELSVMKIAKHAGVTRGVFYFYFESKYAVLAAALGRAWDEFAEARTLTADLDLSLPPAVLTRSLVRDAVNIWHRHHALIAAVVQARSSDDQLAQLWDGLTSGAARQVGRVIAELHAAGRIRPASARLPMLVDALFGMTVWTLLEAGGDTDATTREHMVDVISAVWLASVWGHDSRGN